MKTNLIILLLLFVVINKGIALDEQIQNVVYLKNGSIIKCVILEQSPNDFIRIKTIDGSIFVFKMDEVDKVTNINQVDEPMGIPDSGQTKKLILSALFGGISIPIGDFAKKSGDNAAYAKNGYSIGLTSASINNDNTLIGFSSNLTINSVDVDKLRQEFSVPSYIDIEVDSYVNFDASLMLGLASATNQSQSYIAALVGASYCTLPAMSISDNYDTVSQESDSKLAICYGATAGTNYSSGFSAVIKFITMEPEFEVTVNTPDYDVTEKAKQRISLIVVGLGVSF